MYKIYKHKINIKNIDLHSLDKCSLQIEREYTIEDMKEMFKIMLTIRRLEEISQKLYDEGKIRGFSHLVTGQESIYAALKYAIDAEDTATSSYRCHGLSFVTGYSLESIFMELLGRKGGMCGGKGGSMHLYNKIFYGGHGIVGAQVPVSLGLSFKHKYINLNKSDDIEKVVAKNVSFAFYGDGAAN